MVDTGFATFSTTVDKTNRVLKEIERAYGWPQDRRNQSYTALRAVLHALRDRLTVEESAQFAAQLPMLIRGLYYGGWDPSRSSHRDPSRGGCKPLTAPNRFERWPRPTRRP